MAVEVPAVGAILYRAEVRILPSTGQVIVQYVQWRVERITPCGLWLAEAGYLSELGDGLVFWPVTIDSKVWRRWPGIFAWATTEGALASLKRRSIRRYRYAEQRLEDARHILDHLGLKPPIRSPLGEWGGLW